MAVKVSRQIVGEFSCGVVAPVGIFLKTLQADRLQVTVDRPIELRWRNGLFIHHLTERLDGSRRLKRRPGGDQVIQRRAQRVDVAELIDVRCIQCLLRRHVRRRAHHFAGACQFVAAFEQLRQSKIGNERSILFRVEHDVVRLQVAMQDARSMRLLQSVCGIPRVARRTARLQWSVGQQLRQTRTLNKTHRIETLSVDFAHVIDRDNVVVLKTGSRLRLVSKSLHGCSLRVSGETEELVAAYHLEGDQPVRTLLPRSVDGAHPPSANLLKQLVVSKRP